MVDQATPDPRDALRLVKWLAAGALFLPLVLALLRPRK